MSIVRFRYDCAAYYDDPKKPRSSGTFDCKGTSALAVTTLFDYESITMMILCITSDGSVVWTDEHAVFEQ